MIDTGYDIMDSCVGDLAHRPEKRRLKAQSLANDRLARYSLRASAIPKRVCYRIVGEEFESIWRLSRC